MDQQNDTPIPPTTDAPLEEAPQKVRNRPQASPFRIRQGFFWLFSIVYFLVVQGWLGHHFQERDAVTGLIKIVGVFVPWFVVFLFFQRYLAKKTKVWLAEQQKDDAASSPCDDDSEESAS